MRQFCAVLDSAGIAVLDAFTVLQAGSEGFLASPRPSRYLARHDSTRSSISMTRVFEDDLSTGFATRAIHAGQRPEPLAGAIMTPVYLTSTYVQDALGQNKGYEYARGKNPTREALERNVAALEGGRHGFAFSSGMGCTDSLMKLFKAGDHIVCGENVY